jgi:bifunctional NMN adenylyltransferase/nudix hydrolase
MNTKTFAVVIGRWQINHLGHVQLQTEALKQADEVIIFIGSSFRARDFSNPFTAVERETMIRASFTEDEQARMHFIPIRDYGNDERWTRAIQEHVKAIAGDNKVIVVGHNKDESSYYLKLFPFWESYDFKNNFCNLDAVHLRSAYFTNEDLDICVDVIRPQVPEKVATFLKVWGKLPYRKMVTDEHAKVLASKAKYNFRFSIAADAIITGVEKGVKKVLLVQRGGDIGHGLWAVPGGFVEPDEKIFTGCLRELQEETGIHLWPADAQRTLKNEKVFDNPKRSLRGRIISHAFHFDLGAERLPEIKAGDDAMHAEWVSVEDLLRYLPLFFEDHALILEYFLGNFD